MATKFLDNNGVLYLWNKIKSTFAKTTDIPDVSGFALKTEIPDVSGFTTMEAVEGKGYQTSSQVETIVTGKGYQTSNDVDSAITAKGYTTMTAVEGKGYQTSSQVSDAITAALAGVTGISFSIVDDLPESGAAGTIYLVHKAVTASGNVYTEWIWVNNAWETIGDTTVDLSNYLQKTDITSITNEEIDTITASN